MDIYVILMQMIQLFLVMSLGYFLCKIDMIDQHMSKKLTSLLLSVTTPAMIISSVLSQQNHQSIQSILFVFLVGIVLYLILPIVGFVVVKVMRIPLAEQGLYIFMTVFSNIGFMGFPVMKAIFGEGAIFYTAIFNMIFNLFVYTMGIVIMNFGTGQKVKIEPRYLLSPGVIASLIALFLYFTQIQLPDVLSSTITMIGDITTPIAMLLIGATLARIPVKDVFSELRIYPYTIIKQIIIPVLAYPLLKLFIHDSLVLGVTFIMIAMPVGNSAVLFATEYGGNTELAAKNVFMTTLFSIITIPLVVALFLI